MDLRVLFMFDQSPNFRYDCTSSTIIAFPYFDPMRWRRHNDACPETMNSFELLTDIRLSVAS